MSDHPISAFSLQILYPYIAVALTVPIAFLVGGGAVPAPGDWVDVRFTGATPFDVWAEPAGRAGQQRDPA